MGVITYVVLNLLTGKAKDEENQCTDVCACSFICIKIYLPVKERLDLA